MANYEQFVGPSTATPIPEINSNFSQFEKLLDESISNIPTTDNPAKTSKARKSPLDDPAAMRDKLAAAKIDIKKAIATHKKTTCIEGTTCYQKNTLSELQYKYDKAVEVEQTAPRDVIIAKKNLYTFKYSKQYWNEMERNKYSKLADTKYKEIMNDHAITTNELDLLLDSYSNSLTNKKNMTDYLATLKQENKELEADIRKKLSTLNTNERAVWYETHELGFMHNWSQLMFFIYYIIVVVFCYYYITYKLWQHKPYINRKTYLALLLLFLSWGVINMSISRAIFKVIQFFIGIIPTDAYSKL